MKRVIEPGTVLRYEGTLVEVVGIGEGRTIWMRPIGGDTVCDCCGQIVGQQAVLEDSMNFQQGAEPVRTVET